MDKRTIRYSDWLGTKLRDKRRAARYLNAARSDSPEAFFKALRKVAEAKQQMTKVAEDAGISGSLSET